MEGEEVIQILVPLPLPAKDVEAAVNSVEEHGVPAAGPDGLAWTAVVQCNFPR